ncbi:hypothetical protein D3C81_1357210 [compost metagenome]
MVPGTAVIGTDHVEADLHVGVAGLLEALVATDQFRVTAGDDVALAEQCTACRFAADRVGHRVIARKRTGVIEVLMLIHRLVFRTAGNSGQQQRQPDNTHGSGNQH